MHIEFSQELSANLEAFCRFSGAKPETVIECAVSGALAPFANENGKIEPKAGAYIDDCDARKAYAGDVDPIYKPCVILRERTIGGYPYIVIFDKTRRDNPISVPAKYVKFDETKN